MEMYTYTDWASGNLSLSELEVAYYEGKMTFEIYSKIKGEQEEAYILNARSHFQHMQTNFLNKYDNSLVREILIEEELAKTESMIDTSKTGFPIIFNKVLNGEDGRHALKSADIAHINTHYEGIYPSECKHLDITLKLQYYRWLKWLQKSFTSHEALPDIDSVNYNFRKSNYSSDALPQTHLNNLWQVDQRQITKSQPASASICLDNKEVKMMEEAIYLEFTNHQTGETLNIPIPKEVMPQIKALLQRYSQWSDG